MRNIYYIWLTVILFWSCDSKKNEIDIEQNFIKYYGSNRFDSEFYPLAITETSDNGFLMLSSTNVSAFKDISFTKIDKEGKLEWQFTDSTDFKNPLPLIINDGRILFFATHKSTLNAHLLVFNVEDITIASLREYVEFPYPTSACQVQGGWILQGFDRESQRTLSMKLGSDFSEQWRQKYGLFEDPIQFNSHLDGSNPMPFFCGEIPGAKYFLGTMSAFNLRTLFVSQSDGVVQKNIVGFKYEAGVAQMLNWSGTDFFVVKYNKFGEISVLPKFTINFNSPDIINSQNAEEIPDKIDYEIAQRSRIALKRVVYKGQDAIAFVAETKNKEMLVRFYSVEGNVLANFRYGGNDGVVPGDFILSSDGSLIAFGKVYLAGRIPRVIVSKKVIE